MSVSPSFIIEWLYAYTHCAHLVCDTLCFHVEFCMHHVWLSACLPACLSVCLSVSVCGSVCGSVSVCLSVCLSVSVSVHVCLPVCLSVSSQSVTSFCTGDSTVMEVLPHATLKKGGEKEKKKEKKEEKKKKLPQPLHVSDFLCVMLAARMIGPWSNPHTLNWRGKKGICGNWIWNCLVPLHSRLLLPCSHDVIFHFSCEWCRWKIRFHIQEYSLSPWLNIS